MSAEQEYTELRQRLQTDKSSHGQDNLRDFLRLVRVLDSNCFNNCLEITWQLQRDPLASIRDKA